MWNLEQGGAQSYVSNLLRFHGKEEGLESELIVLTGPGVFSKLVGKYTNRLVYLGMKHGFDMVAAVRLYIAIKASRPNVIHSHTNTILVFIVCAILNAPLIYTEHGTGLLKDRKYNMLIGWLIYKIFYRWVQCFVAVSDTMRAKMVGMSPLIDAYTTTVPNGVDIEKLLTLKSNIDGLFQPGKKQCKYKICAVGRLTELKGFDLFMEVAAEVNRRQQNVSFFLIGDGELREQLETLATNLSITQFVNILGYRDDAQALMKEFDLYLMTSHFESFGLTLIEAMGSGVPVVAAKAEGSFEEIIEHGVDGILVDNRSPQLIANAIIQLLQDDKLRTKLGSAAQKKIALKYTMASNAGAIYNCYKSVSSHQMCGKHA